MDNVKSANSTLSTKSAVTIPKSKTKSPMANTEVSKNS